MAKGVEDKAEHEIPDDIPLVGDSAIEPGSLERGEAGGEQGEAGGAGRGAPGEQEIPEVHDFLSRLFHDHDLIPLPFQSYLAPLIAKRRTPKIEQQYTDIGGGSPILRWTRTQGAAMCALLDELNPSSAPHKPYVMFRYAEPLTETCLEEMKRDGVQRAIAFTQYPQYSCSTTGSSLNELMRVATLSTRGGKASGEAAAEARNEEKLIKGGLQWGGQGQVEWSVIDRWPTHQGFINAVAHNVKQGLEKFSQDERKDAVILFSAHSLPLSVVNRGDPYITEVAASVLAVMQTLGHTNPYRLTWQSQVGPSAWQGPQTSDAVKGLGKLGKKNILLVPIAFTSDHIETLFELDIEVKEEAHEVPRTGRIAQRSREQGALDESMKNPQVPLKRAYARAPGTPICHSKLLMITLSVRRPAYQLGINLQRADSLNDSPIFIRALADIVSTHMNDYSTGKCGPTSIQMGLRCPGCTNPRCESSKTFFANGGKVAAA
ncbi:hypothetical protein QFC19_004145 [Naganishia cerealis]|uniref:Uncharacterized protein n=1 Tax=Naganishia cerealis TaxID=610337 RepID=A0ACC2VYY7_9TREE|nr:hypothetical protein QFC19_004145 [Naganishia cerealis]